MFEAIVSLVKAYHSLNSADTKLKMIGLNIESGDEGMGDAIFGAYGEIEESIAELLQIDVQQVTDIMVNMLEESDFRAIARELIKLPVACEDGWRKVKLIFFKESGKYYTTEEETFPEKNSVYDIIEFLKENERRYRGMHIFIKFNEMDNIGFPCLILESERKWK